MDEFDPVITVDHGPSDKWHPNYDSFVDFLNAEAKPRPPDTPRLRKRKLRGKR